MATGRFKTYIEIKPEHKVDVTQITNNTDLFEKHCAFTPCPLKVTLYADKWKNVDAAIQKKDPNWKDVPEDCAGVVACRYEADLDIPNPANTGLVYSTMIVAPHVEDSKNNVQQCIDAAEFGVQFLFHTTLDPAVEESEVVKNNVTVHLAFRAINGRPNADLEYDIWLM